MSLRHLILTLTLLASPAIAQPSKADPKTAEPAEKTYKVLVSEWVGNRWVTRREYDLPEERARKYVAQINALGGNWAATSNLPEEEATRDRKKMAGVWFLVLREGEKKPVGRDAFYFITEDAFIFYGVEPDRAFQIPMAYKIDTTKSPRWIDTTNLVSKRTKKGLYEFVGKDRLKLCQGKSEEERPTEFKNTATAVFLELERSAYKTVEEYADDIAKRHKASREALLKQLRDAAKAEQKD